MNGKKFAGMDVEYPFVSLISSHANKGVLQKAAGTAGVTVSFYQQAGN
jgi:hypothetical protein